MNIADIVAAERVTRAASAHNKKRALEQLAEILTLGTPYLTAGEIFRGLVDREKLGSTGIGGGVAIPHARVKGIDDCVGALMRLREPMVFEADNDTPVDLVFGLVVPEKSTAEHLEMLRVLADLFSQPQATQALRAARDDAALYRALIAHDRAA